MTLNYFIYEEETTLQIEIPYDRQNAVAYARKWALTSNPLFYDFTGQGGDCTNFVSQCVYAGCGIMNPTPIFGWYYRSPTDRAPAWSGVEEFYRFMIGDPEFIKANGGIGPYASNAADSRVVELGDVVQLADEEGRFYHSLLITGITENDLLLTAHTNDAEDRPLSSYNYASLRILHIEGARLDWNVPLRVAPFFEGIALE
jgi:hypothetical protein